MYIVQIERRRHCPGNRSLQPAEVFKFDSIASILQNSHDSWNFAVAGNRSSQPAFKI